MIPKCEIKIILDNDKSEYETGEIISGKVLVNVNKDFKCRSLTLDLFWRTHGYGSKDFEITRTLTLKKDNELWLKGDEYSFPFDFDALNGPITLLRDDLQVIWYIEAKLMTFYFGNFKTEKSIVINPGIKKMISANEYNFGNGKTTQMQQEFHDKFIGNHFYIILGCFFIFTGLLFLLIGNSDHKIPIIIFSILWSFLGIYLILSKALGKWVQGVLGNVYFSINHDASKAGDLISCRIKLTPNTNVIIKSLSIKFICTESLVFDEDDTHGRVNNILYEKEETALENEFLSKYNTLSKDISFQIPIDAVPTFKGNYNEISWIFKASIKSKSCPKWVGKMEVIVSP